MSNCDVCGKVTTRKFKKCPSCSRKGQKAWNKGLIGFMKGRKVSYDTRHRQSISQIGEKNHNWKGGISGVKKVTNWKYWQWRDEVILRDKSVCQICFKTCFSPIAHHIKSKSHFPELVYDIENGKTLCFDDHQLIHKKVSYYRLKEGELKETLAELSEKTLSQVWEETLRKVQRILAETKELYSMSVMPTRAPSPQGKIYAELTGDRKM